MGCSAITNLHPPVPTALLDQDEDGERRAGELDEPLELVHPNSFLSSRHRVCRAFLDGACSSGTREERRENLQEAGGVCVI